MTDVRVRRATRQDRAVLLNFHRALYVAHRDRVMLAELAPLYAYRDLDAALREDVEALLSNPDAVTILAERGTRAVGYATGHVESDERRVLPLKGVVEDWFVDEAERGAGVGALLLQTLEAIFTTAGCRVMESATWPFNEGARRAHEALGFREIEVKYRKRIGG